ncbi:MAG: efflux RND transporter periplasmic adaptor subunit [Lachnospiraceae bacterium]|nr:efflux RND transporter periplasmic adaptor subunit [Lachnospiraceae bacterium]
MKKSLDKKILTRILIAVLCLGAVGGLTALLIIRGPLLSPFSKGAEEATGEAPAGGAKQTSADAAVPYEEEPELVEPVGSVVRYVPAEFRELFRVTTCQGVVCPDTTEYTYESSRPFGNYGALPGDEVRKGDALFSGTAESVEDEIDAIEEENAELLEAFTNTASDMAYDISKAKKTEYERAQAYQNLCASAPEPDSPWYAGWAKGAMPAEKAAKQAKAAREKLEQSLKEKQEQFDLQYAYNEKRIERLETEDRAAGVSSAEDGVVVASSFYLTGDSIPEGTSVLAVGNPQEKEIICEYVSKSVVNKAKDIYAIVDGKHFQVQYEVMETEEYRLKKQKDGEVYTTFHLIDPEDEAENGQYAVIVIVEERIPDALCVPREAVSRDERGSFVYRYDGGESIYTPVQTGSYDAAFIEILSGLHEGDPVVCDTPWTVGDKTLTVDKGEVSNPFSTDGFLYYPSAEWLENPAKNGTSYLKELLVNRYEQVEAGQVVARIEIVGDDIEIARLRRKIDRQNERLADLNQKKSKTFNKEELEALDRTIRDRNRTIESLNRQLDKLTRYLGIYELTAPESGIITDRTERKAGELISYREKIVQLSRDDSCFIMLEDKGKPISYGNEASVRVRGRGAEEKTMVGTVVTVNPWALSKDLRRGFAIIRLPMEDMASIADLTGSVAGENGLWNRIRFGIDMTTGRMKDVLLVPRKAVYTTGSNETYVITRRPDGSARLIRFVAGGSDPSYYWVAYGDLEEGMELCSE